ncbi:unnamed protein product [Symbiodinium natans]|uniref:Cyclic nucleotide-binding domain-containing protein n=1 Tax=Symbiodinium natans TaxID=878477 RepID=A0A812N137_9DINO|nr:unnamed protein product [Symbiodinium natans]
MDHQAVKGNPIKGRPPWSETNSRHLYSVIIEKAAETDAMLVMLEGEAQVEAQNGSCIGSYGPNSSFGEVVVLGLVDTFPARVRAATDCRVLPVKAAAVRHALAMPNRLPEERQELHRLIEQRRSQVLNAVSGSLVCTFKAAGSWSIADVKEEISNLTGRATSLLPSGRQLLLGCKLLQDGELLKNLGASAVEPPGSSKRTLELRMVEASDDFYVRYFARRDFREDHELHEFEFCSSGRFRFARDFLQGGFFQGKMLRKECFLSAASLRVLRGMVLKSGILQADDADLPLPTRQSRQELEIKCEGTHVTLATQLHPSLPHIDGGRRLDHERTMSDFDALAEDIKSFGKSILEVFNVQLDGAAVATARPRR